MDLDLSGLWTWIVPLWGLFLLIFFLGGALQESVIFESIATSLQTGGGRQKQRR